MKEILKKIETEALEAIEKVKNLDLLKEIEVKFLGRKGKLTELLKGIKDLTDKEKREFGTLLNQTKKSLLENFAFKTQELKSKDLEAQLSQEFFDTTIPGKARPLGYIHPLAQVQKELEDIFSRLGFVIADGPEVESELYNFIGLNIPKDHPARDMQDTFYIKDKDDPKHGKLILRPQTSPAQVRTMQTHGAPLRIVVPGRTFRYEALDASHEFTFAQIEGLLVDKDISIGHLKGIMIEALSELFKAKLDVRLRPGYFPFVEPGLELDFRCILCQGKGCKTCKHVGWIEIGGCGMVHPNVLKAGNVDPEKYQGWAFGFGLERITMMRYKIPDIRVFNSGDIRVTQQFN